MLGRESKYNTGMLPTKNLSTLSLTYRIPIYKWCLIRKNVNFITKELHINPFRAETMNVTTEKIKHLISSILTYFTTCMKWKIVSFIYSPKTIPIRHSEETNKCIWTFKSILYYIMYIVCLLHVSVTPVSILWDVHYKEYITKPCKPRHRCKIPSFKIYGLKYIY